MKRLEEDLPYLGSGSVAGIEALARLAVAGVEIGFDPEAMGGGGDPFADYFGKVEAAGADQANKFLQWADEQIQRGAKTAKIQGEEISLIDYKVRLEEIRYRTVIDIPSMSLKNEVNRQKVEKRIGLDEITPWAISRQIGEFSKFNPALAEGISLLLRADAPSVISEVADYLEHLEPPLEQSVEEPHYSGYQRIGLIIYRVVPKRIGIPKVAIDGKLHLDEWPEPPLPLEPNSVPVSKSKPSGIRLGYPEISFKCTQDISLIRVVEQVNVIPAWFSNIGKGESFDSVLKKEISIDTVLDENTLALCVRGYESGIANGRQWKASRCLVQGEPLRSSLRKAVVQVLAELDV